MYKRSVTTKKTFFSKSGPGRPASSKAQARPGHPTKAFVTSSLLFLAETAIVAEVWAVSTSFNSGGVEKSSSLADSGHNMSGGQGALGKTIEKLCEN